MNKYKFIDLIKEDNFSFKKIHNDKKSFYNKPGMVGETMAKNMVDAVEALATKYRKSKMQKWLFDEIFDENENYDWHKFVTHYSKKDLSRLRYALIRIDKMKPINLLYDIYDRSSMLKDKLMWSLEYLAYKNNREEFEKLYASENSRYGLSVEESNKRLKNMINLISKKLKKRI